MHLQHRDISVESDNPLAESHIALGIAKVLTENWLEGHSESDPIEVHVDHASGVSVKYVARINYPN